MSNREGKDKLECRQNLHTVLTVALKRTGELHYKSVVRETLIKFPVTQAFVEKYIKEFYIDGGIVTLKDGILYPVIE
jgi:hypothetical protein